jgi:hypothetical protein
MLKRFAYCHRCSRFVDAMVVYPKPHPHPQAISVTGVIVRTLCADCWTQLQRIERCLEFARDRLAEGETQDTLSILEAGRKAAGAPGETDAMLAEEQRREMVLNAKHKATKRRCNIFDRT